MLTTVLAAEGSPVTIQLLPLVTTIVVFVIAFLILKTKVWPKITQGLDDRDAKIRAEIKAAEDAREQANAALKGYEESLGKARQEAAEMITRAKATAKTAGDELRRRNEAEVAEMKTRARRDIDAARQSAVNEIHAEASNLAAAIASKILKREINAGDQQRLLDESLQELHS